jgi:hypothetical protein
VPDLLPRRRVLAASAAALPALLATAGCQSSDLFAGPDPLAGRPSLSPGVITLQAVIASEQAMIALYQAAAGAGERAANQPPGQDGLLEGLLAQHRQHLTQLQARLILPPGPGPRASSGSSPSAAPARVTTAALRAAESASAARLVRQLATVEPALAQLFASIAASDATHAVVLGG